MKNKIISTIAIILIVGFSVFFIYNKVTTINTYKEIDFKELKKLVEGNDKFILFIGQEDCTHCKMYKEYLNVAIPKYHVLVNYIDVSKLSDEEIAYIKARFAFSGTPTTVFVREGTEDASERVVEKEVGSRNSNELKELFIKYGYIKE